MGCTTTGWMYIRGRKQCHRTMEKKSSNMFRHKLRECVMCRIHVRPPKPEKLPKKKEDAPPQCPRKATATSTLTAYTLSSKRLPNRPSATRQRLSPCHRIQVP